MLNRQHLKVLLIASPVAPVAEGMAGGVDHNLLSSARALVNLGHQVQIFAPKHSKCAEIPCREFPGELHPLAQCTDREDSLITPDNSVLMKMFETAKEEQNLWDVVIHFAYDLLPYQMSCGFHRPLLHVISMSSLNQEFNQVVARELELRPCSVAALSKVQAKSFSFGDKLEIIGIGLDVAEVAFKVSADKDLLWCGRIVQEKGLSDALQAALICNSRLSVYGYIQDNSLFTKLRKKYAPLVLDYKGFLPASLLRRELGGYRAMLFTPKWEEAFGIVMLEALASGVPVISYERGGALEVVEEGINGFLVKVDSPGSLSEGVKQVDCIDRNLCRKSVEDRYSLANYGQRLEAWLVKNLARKLHESPSESYSGA